jgi:threonine dehydratase
MTDQLLPGILPSRASVAQAAELLRAHLAPTPLRASDALSALAGVPVWLKLESAQVTGSFKVRGALTVLARLAPEARTRGVVASSAGNHGLGVAFAARHFGAPATLFVPHDAPQVKRDGIAALGATVDATADDYDHAMVLAKAHAARTGTTFVNPCLGEDLLAGQGTVALEVLADCPTVRTLFVCVGGGGLLGGVGAVLRRDAPTVRIIGAQSVRTAAMARSLAAGAVVPIASEPTLADGLAGQIDDDALAIGQQCLDDIVTVTEEQLGRAIAWLHRHEGVQAEGAGAVAVAALLEAVASGRAPTDGPVVAIVSGRNIDPSRHRGLLETWRTPLDG